MLRQFMDKGTVPHCLLLSGPSGCGKTTIGRILKDYLSCGDHDYFEVNCADFKGIDMIRDIRRLVNLAPIEGDVKIWFIDEAHKLTNDAQNAFLKLLEDTPKHAYFFLATTDPTKLLKTIITRATEVKLMLLDSKALVEVVERVCKLEKIKISEDVLCSIVENAEGSARKALVLLGQVANLTTEREQLAALAVSAEAKCQAIELARILINPRSSWNEAAVILKKLNDEPENVRYLVLGYARTVLLGGGPLAPRAFKLIDVFSQNFYDSKQAGLAAACYAMYP